MIDKFKRNELVISRALSTIAIVLSFLALVHSTYTGGIFEAGQFFLILLCSIAVFVSNYSQFPKVQRSIGLILLIIILPAFLYYSFGFRIEGFLFDSLYNISPKIKVVTLTIAIYTLSFKFIKKHQDLFNWYTSIIIFPVVIASFFGALKFKTLIIGNFSTHLITPFSASILILLCAAIILKCFSKKVELILLTWLSGLFYIIDLNTPLGIATAALYIIPIILATRFLKSSNDFIHLAFFTIMLTVFGLFYSDSISAEYSTVLINRIISVICVIFSAYLAYTKASIDSQVLKKNQLLLRQSYDLKQFAYLTWHQMNSPIRHISMYSKILEDNLEKNFPKAQEDNTNIEAFTFINKAISYLTNILNNLKALNSLKIRKLEKISIQSFLTNTIGTMPMPDDAKYEIKAKCKIVTADPILLKNIFTNLIDNSIKYRRKNKSLSIIIKISQHDDTYHFNISDNGIGIKEEDRQKALDSFQRLQTDSKVEGSGIGLSFIKKCIELHEGRLWFESTTDNEGLSISFTIKRLDPAILAASQS